MHLAHWQQELRDSVRTLEQLERFLPLPAAGTPERSALESAVKEMRLSITPHSARLIDWAEPADPLRRIAVPDAAELRVDEEELADPIGDAARSPVPFLTHRYRDRALIYATFFCSLFCRFCFRRTRTGEATPGPGEADKARITEYLSAHPEIEEAILTGGDPLTLLDEHVEDWLRRLAAVRRADGSRQIRRIRIHTRVPVNLPSRITPELVALLRRYADAEHPLIVVSHFNHPREIAPENVRALAAFADAGIVLKNQHPLLRGVNDSAETLAALYRRLSDVRVQPYYLHHLDLARGTGHFRVPLEEGMCIYAELQGVSGIALPRYVLDIPGGHGKVPVNGDWLRRMGADDAGTDWEARSPLSGAWVRYREPRT